jgi:hypothetical protein
LLYVSSFWQGATLAGFFAGVSTSGAFSPTDGTSTDVFDSGANFGETCGECPAFTEKSAYGRCFCTYPPWFKATDVYGNVNTTISGIGYISLPYPRDTLEEIQDPALLNVPDMAGFGFCRHQQGTSCLSGRLTATVRKGVGYFTEVYIRHSGPGFRFLFEFEGMTAVSRPFNVLPPPPRVSGISFSETFSSIVVKFDAATNLAGMKDTTDCRRIFSSTSTRKLGAGAECSWPDASTLLATLGNQADLHPGDLLSFTGTARITSTMYWRPVVQAGGIVSNQRIYAPDKRVLSDSAVIRLSSGPMPRLECKAVMLPESVKDDTLVRADKDVAAADIEHMIIDGTHYMAVANHCLGRNCYFDLEVVFTTGIFDLDSVLYRWEPDGRLVEHQRIPTHGANDLKSFVLRDAMNTGGYADRQFLAVANYRTLSKVKPTVNAQIWTFDPAKQEFILRQAIPTVGGTSVDVMRHGDHVYIALCNTGTQAYVTILRWVPGSFREDINGHLYGWLPGQTFGWVPGLFSEPIQTIATDNAMSAVLYRPFGESGMFLAVSNFMKRGSNRVNVTIYRWREQVCYDDPFAADLNISCFDSILAIPAVGARTVTPFNVNGTNYMAIANHFEGDSTSERSVHYEVDSFIYSLDYTPSHESFRLHQVGIRHMARPAGAGLDKLMRANIATSVCVGERDKRERERP